VALAFAALCVAALAILQQQSGTPNLETYSTFDAHAGGFRAWYQLLERMNVPVERFEERAGLLDASTRALVRERTSVRKTRSRSAAGCATAERSSLPGLGSSPRSRATT
jgi:hypothetical protein